MISVRTCVGCRTTDQRQNLLRFVVRDEQVILDFTADMPGRGAWLHASAACLDKAIARRAFGRALRVSIDVDPIHLREQAERLMDK